MFWRYEKLLDHLNFNVDITYGILIKSLRFNKVFKLQILTSTQSLNHFQNILHIYFNFLQSHHQWCPKNVHINKLSLKNYKNSTDIYQKDGKESVEDHILNRFEEKVFL